MPATMTQGERDLLSKVPAITFGSWVIKILATTLRGTPGEQGGDGNRGIFNALNACS